MVPGWDRPARSRRAVLKTGLGGALGGLVLAGLPRAAAAELQPDWRFCTKCRALWYNGGPDDGRCAAGGRHRAGNSVDYVLTFAGLSRAR